MESKKKKKQNNRKLKTWVAILIGMALGISLFFIFLLGRDIFYHIKYQNSISKLDEKLKEDYNHYSENKDNQLKYDISSIHKFEDCIQSPLEEEEYTSSLKENIKKLNNQFAYDSNAFAFHYEDITTGFSLSYNENNSLFAASTIKAAVVMYAYDLAKKGELDLEDEMTYLQKYYTGGTGVIKNDKVGSKYTIRYLASVSIIYSDNIGHKMLCDYLGIDNIKKYWSQYGVTSLMTYNQYFGNLSAKDASTYMRVLYNHFYLKNTQLDQELVSYFVDSGVKYITNGTDFNLIANKYGLEKQYVHDNALIFDDDPYLLSVLTTKQYTNHFESFFKDVSKLVKEIHEEYNSIKSNYCYDKYFQDKK